MDIEANYQVRVGRWISACFGEAASRDVDERSHRFAEEAFELLQAMKCSKSDVLAILDYVYSREPGEEKEEVGGVLLTLSGLCNAIEVDISSAGETELEKVWEKIDYIREKRRSRRPGSPLP